MAVYTKGDAGINSGALTQTEANIYVEHHKKRELFRLVQTQPIGKSKSLRKKNKMSQLDLEVATGINHSDISRIENGKLNIEFFTMVKLAAALNGELVDFFK
ncbi:Helix-turn-helix [Parafilimonas terrae]|uniref:Helix-turn-helix n=2 Tax=Parafilimonas terrae TaxID=1465490 RepID=A0A1I5T9G0_9BACT|nr:Helix-turn-helix [Parafilimonas terrae]